MYILNAFLLSFASVFLAEFGDKTQLTILLLTHKTNRHLLFLTGVISGFFLADILAVIAGQFLSFVLPATYVRIIAGIIFILFGIWSLRKRSGKAEDKKQMGNPFVTGLLFIFLGEFGDKTQIAIALLATKYNPFLVFFGSLCALALVSIITVYLSKLFLSKINKKILTIASGILFIVLGILFITLSLNKSNTQIQTSPSYALLSSSWKNYKNQFISNGRVIDTSQNGDTTSEGQSYALLRSVWMSDKPTFDSVWNFTEENMKRPNDNLFGWNWGKLKNNAYGFIANGGENTASDADSDIALALIIAANRWGEETYLQDAKNILHDFWIYDTDTADGKRYITGGNWAAGGDPLIIDPSYFAPYALRIFAKVDPTHDWNSLIDPGYALLLDSGKVGLDKTQAVGLPPDWLAINRETGVFSSANVPDSTSDYSFDAIRIPWKIGLDYLWNKDKRAYTYLTTLTYLSDMYIKDGKLASIYSHDGNIVDSSENPAMYGTSIGYFMFVKPDLARQIYEEKIIKLYTNNNAFNKNLPYYEQNWLWFGVALYNNFLTPLSGS